MSNLVPTPRTDKNGRTQIRHLRADAVTVAARIPSPPAPARFDIARSDAAAVSASLEAVHDAFGLMYADDPPEVAARHRKLLAYLHRSDPVMIDLALRLAHEGPAPARRAVACRLRSIVSEINDGFDNFDDPRVVRHSLRSIVQKRGRNNIASAWHAGALRADAGAPDIDDHTLGFFAERVAIADMDLRSGADHGDLSRDAEAAVRWRGLAALVLADEGLEVLSVLWKPETKQKVREFVPFAGAHPDPAEVIAAYRETRSLDPGHLAHVVERRRDTEPVLRDGAL